MQVMGRTVVYGTMITGMEHSKGERKKTYAANRSDLDWDASRSHPEIFEHHDKHPEIQHELQSLYHQDCSTKKADSDWICFVVQRLSLDALIHTEDVYSIDSPMADPSQ
jgi:hypothetical protein